jgi:phosphoesterase RecJ-like protein
MTRLDHRHQLLFQAVSDANRILLVTHKEPDGDAVGTAAAFLIWLASHGKNAAAFCPSPLPANFAYLDRVHHFTDDASVFDRPHDLIIIFDCGDLKRAGAERLASRPENGCVLANVDHHQTNPGYGDINIVDANASSTSEIVYRFFKQNGVDVNEALATCLLTGICTDTSNFSNALTNARALEIAGDLISRGARFNDILKNVWMNKTSGSLRIWGLMLSRLSYNPVYDTASSYLTEEELEGVPDEATEGMMNFLSAVVREAETFVLLKERPDGSVRGSYRSAKRDVSKAAGILGGGGHKYAAGFTIQGKIEAGADGRARIVQADRTIEPDMVTE